jgi:UDP-N-acetylmuramoyl-tripeptide--D-alanyl-D-alanine ligase
MTINQIAHDLNLNASDDRPIRAIVIDSRLVQPGDLFVTIIGEQFNGHDFIKEAIDRGAIAILASEPHTVPETVTYLQVGNTLDALAMMAKAHRQRISCPVIALTGSNGKTSVKEMIAAILPKPSLATQGNFNNHIGAPLSVLSLKPEHRYAVFELGANHVGDIAYTVDIVKPTIALINNIGPAHIGEFGSIEAIANTKGEIYDGLSAEGIAIINDDEVYHHFWDTRIGTRQSLRFSSHHPETVYATDIQEYSNQQYAFELHILNETIPIQLQTPGYHAVQNALAAATCCFAAGISSAQIARGLNAFQGVSGRLTRIKGHHNALIIDDTYNANLQSTLMALDVLSQYPGHKIFIFGNMVELGEWSNAHHMEVGHAARSKGIHEIMTVGTQAKLASDAFGEAGQHFETQSDLIQCLSPKLNRDTTVLIKGSNSSKMGNIVNHLIP